MLRHVCAAFLHAACVVSFLHDSAVNDAYCQLPDICYAPFPFQMTAPSLSASSRDATKTLPRTLRIIPALVGIIRGRALHDLAACFRAKSSDAI
jgi:hypothetical protein